MTGRTVRGAAIALALAWVVAVTSACGSDDRSSSGSAAQPAAAVPTPTVGRPALPCDARFLGIGDSIAAQSVGPATDHLHTLGYTTRLDARWGTGPLDHDPDWVAVAARLEAEFHPTVVLAIFYGNYAQPIEGVAPDSPEEYARWGERVGQLTRVFTDAGAQVVWLEPPPRPVDAGGTVSPTWDATVAAVASLPGVRTRPTGTLVAGPDGRWTPDEREPDGVHLTPEGGDRMAADVVQAALEVSGCSGR